MNLAETQPENIHLPFTPPEASEQDRMVEAILFASGEPLSTGEIEARMPTGSDAAEALRRVEALYEGRGVTLIRVAGKWAFRTASDLSFVLRSEAQETRKLSRAATETLAIVAYHQPVTRTEIEEIRGVAVSKGTLDMLLDLEWIKLGRRRQTPGRPVTFVTTELFLEHFGTRNRSLRRGRGRKTETHTLPRTRCGAFCFTRKKVPDHVRDSVRDSMNHPYGGFGDAGCGSFSATRAMY